jgi:hypothetical protein
MAITMARFSAAEPMLNVRISNSFEAQALLLTQITKPLTFLMETTAAPVAGVIPLTPTQ